MKTKLLLIVFCTVFLSYKTYSQLCTGSLGDPVVNIDFGSGTGKGAALGSAITAYTYSGSGKLDEGYYTIANTTTGLRDTAWHITTDHTGNTNGYMMIVNASVLATAGIFYTKTVTNLCPNTTYEFSAWLMNVMTFTSPNPDVTFTVSTTSGTVLGTYNSGSLAVTSSGTWKQFGFYFNTGATSDVVITMLNNAVGAAPGNDLALDDITFRACGPIVSAAVQNNNSTSFSTCQNATASYTLAGSVGTAVYSDPAYQWQLSTDKGVTWTDIAGATATTTNVILSTAGTFMYRMTTAQNVNISSPTCRVSSNTVTITVMDTPVTPTINLVQASCTLPTGTITVQAQTNCTYSIDGIHYQTSSVFANLAGGDYSVTAKNTNGCVSTAIAVHIDTLVPNLGTTTVTVVQPVICVDPYGSITFTNTDYEYSFDDGATWATTKSKSGLVADTYKVKSRNSYGCETPVVTVEIIVPPGYPPTPSVTMVQPDCFTATGSITVLDTAPFYSFDNGLSWTTNNSKTNLIAGKYQVVIKNALGCSSLVANTADIKAFVNTEPLPVASSPQQFCVQENATINDLSIAGTAIKWYDASTNGNLLANTTTLQTKIYYASQTVTTCESLRIPIQVVVQNTAAPTGDAQQDFCTTQKPTIANLAVIGTNVVWYNSVTNTTALATTTSLANGLTYYAKQTVNGCESINRLAVNVSIVSPSIPVNDATYYICDDLNDGAEIVDLNNYKADITSCTSCTFSYFLSKTAAENKTTTEQITAVTNYNLPLGTSLFYVRIESNDKCYQVVALNLILVGSPIISIADNIALCQNKSITVNAGSGFDAYLWSTTETSQVVTIATAGGYSVTVSINQANAICSSTKNFTVFDSKSAVISKIETQDWTDTDNVIVVELTDANSGNYEFSIDGINYQDSNTFSGLFTGDYKVYVRDKNGCGIVNQEVFILNYPKFFTPNGDGYNDTWAVKFSASEPTIFTQIYDRFNKLIKELDSTSSWDGTYGGYNLPSTDYWFVVKRANGKVFKGHFSMKR